MPVNKSQRFSLRLLLDQRWIDTLNDLSKAHMISRLGLIRKYIRAGMETDLEEIKEGITKLRRIEATKKELSQKVKAHEGIKTASINEPLEY